MKTNPITIFIFIFLLYITSFFVLSRRNVSHLGYWRFLDRGGDAYIEQVFFVIYFPLIKIDEKIFKRYHSKTLPD